MTVERETPVIEVSRLTAAYGDDVILEDVSFAVRRGEIFGILGGSGSGKSTILKHLIGLAVPASGRVQIFGRDIGRLDAAERLQLCRRFGILYQSGALFGSMTVGENVALPLEELTDLPRAAIRDIVRLKLDLVGLAEYEDLTPAELSGGMRKRAGLARAMALDPELLFFDEPSSGLDPVLAAGLDQLILKLRRTLGTTMVIVSHDLDSTFTIADRVILVDRDTKGIVAEGDPRELMRQQDTDKVRDFFSRCGSRH